MVHSGSSIVAIAGKTSHTPAGAGDCPHDVSEGGVEATTLDSSYLEPKYVLLRLLAPEPRAATTLDSSYLEPKYVLLRLLAPEPRAAVPLAPACAASHGIVRLFRCR